MTTIQQAIQTLSKVYNYAFLTDSQTDELDWVIELLKDLPPAIWKGEIDTLQRYDMKVKWYTTLQYESYEVPSDNWEYVKYSDLVNFLKNDIP